MMQTTAMKSPAFQSYHSGFSLVELMIALVVGLLISAIAISSFLGHARVLYQQLSYNQATEDVSETFAVLSRLVMQAQRSTVSVTSSATSRLQHVARPTSSRAVTLDRPPSVRPPDASGSRGGLAASRSMP